MTADLAAALLHGGVHAGEASSSGGLDPIYAIASVVLVGGAGGLLYWYYGTRQASSTQSPPAKQ